MTISDAHVEKGRSSGGELVYAEYIRDLVELQDRYKSSMEQRAGSVISTSSTLAALLFGFAALARGTLGITTLPGLVLVLLGIVALALVVAVAFATLLYAPRDYAGPKVTDLKALIGEAWDDGTSTDYAGYQVAEARLAVLAAAKTQNERKATLLRWAVRSELAAIAALGASIIAILLLLK